MKILSAVFGIILLSLVPASAGPDWAPGENILPPLTAREMVSTFTGPGSRWMLVRRAETRTEYDVDRRVAYGDAEGSLRVRTLNSAGYAEWRVTPRLMLEPGSEYTFSVWVKNRTEETPPYLEVYSFDSGNRPSRIALSYGKGGYNDWYRIHRVLSVPADSAGIRIGLGLRETAGEAWFSSPVLTEGAVRPDREFNTGFNVYTEPSHIKFAPVELSSRINAGDVFKIKFPAPEGFPADELDFLRLHFYRDGRASAVSAFSPRIEPDRHTGHMVVELPISPYALPGEYDWELEGVSSKLKPEGAAPYLSIMPGRRPERKEPYRFDGSPANRIRTPGGEHAPFIYSTRTPSVENYMRWQAAGSHLYEVVITMGHWESYERWDISSLEENMMQILEADPFASIYVWIRVDVPDWWRREHPEDIHVSNTGSTSNHQSFASEKWLDDSIEAVKLLIRKIKERPVGESLGGVFIIAFRGGEWQLWGENLGEYDCSPAAKRAFEKWQADRGVPGGEKIEIPHPALEYPFQPGEEYARARSIFFEFLADRQARNIIDFTGALKEEFGEELSVGVLYGFIFELAHSDIRRILFGGHLGVSRVYREAPIDMVSVTSSYALRGPGRGHAFMYPFGSALLNGITPVIEDDVRNYMLPYIADAGGRVLPDIKSSVLSMRKLKLLAASAGSPLRHLALIQGHDFFQSPPVISEIARWNTKVAGLEPSAPGAAGQVALVVDPGSLAGLSELPDANLSARVFLSEIRDTLARTGRPITYIVMDDWLENRDLWDTIAVPFPGLLGEDTMRMLGEEFGADLSDAGPGAGILVISRGGRPGFIFADDLNSVYEYLAVDEAKKLGRNVLWYVGKNFAAVYDGREINLVSPPRVLLKQNQIPD